MEDEEDLYDCVYDDEDGGEIYEDLMKPETLPPPVSSLAPSGLRSIFVQCKSRQASALRGDTKRSFLLIPCVLRVQPFHKQAEIDLRSCCLTEIKQTEEKYTEMLESIEKVLTSGGLWQPPHPKQIQIRVSSDVCL